MANVIHATFGEGVVINNDNDFITVDFNGVTKKLAKMYANLQNLDGSKYEGRETFEERVDRFKDLHYNEQFMSQSDMRNERRNRTEKLFNIKLS